MQATTFVPGTYIPAELSADTSMSGPVSAIRSEIRIPCDQSSITSSSNYGTFKLTSGSALKFKAFRFKAAFSATGGTYVRCSNGIWTCIRRIRVLAGTKEMVNIENYNLISVILNSTGVLNYPSAVGFMTAGMGSPAQRNSLAAGSIYYIPLTTNFFQNILPIALIRDELRIEVYFEEPTKFIETDGTNPSFLMSNMEMIFEEYGFANNAYLSAMQRKLDSDGRLVFKWADCQYNGNTVTGNGQAAIDIPAKFQLIKMFLSVMRTSGTLQTTTLDDKFETWNPNGLTQYYFRINNIYIPVQPIENSGVTPLDPHAYLQMIQTLRGWSPFNNELIDEILAQNYYTNKFLVAHNFAAFEDPLSGISTVNGASTWIYYLNLTNVVSQQVVDMFVFFESAMVLGKDGLARLVQ